MKNKEEEWFKNPDNWKLGIIYFNKEDKRLFPPKRWLGRGWTINFANPISVALHIVLFTIVFWIIMI